MGKALLYLLVLVFGIFVYFASFKHMVIYPLLIPIVLLFVLWYIVSFYISKKMIEKQRPGEEMLVFKGQLIDKNKDEVIYGALAVTRSEFVFYKRKGWKGGVEIIWSAFVPALESYEMCEVDGKHKGVKLSFKGELRPILIASKTIAKSEEAFSKTIGWQ